MSEVKTSRKAFRDQLVTSILSAPVVYVPFPHYGYVDEILKEIFPESSDNPLPLGLDITTIYQYDKGRGEVDFATKKVKGGAASMTLLDLLTNLVNRDENAGEEQCRVMEENGLHYCKVFLLRNIIPCDGEYAKNADINDPAVQILLQTYVQRYWRGDYDKRTTVVMVSPAPVSALPTELKDLVSVVDVIPPTIDEIQSVVEELPLSDNLKSGNSSDFKADLCRTLQGLYMFEIDQILGSAMARTNGYITRMTTAYALEEKQRIVRKSGIIEVISPDVSFEDVGGLDILRKDMAKKAKVFKNLSLATSDQFRVPLPKGILILGMPGCGKSMIAKSIATEFNVSLLRLDISSLMGQYVGQSEENLRRALRTAEAAHPCVLWIDEIEKAFHGANSGNADENDSLVMRMMGYFLTWMQERKTAVYIVATANDTMRPEFMRKGRFDEVYFVDFPNQAERKAIFESKIRRFDRTTENNTIFDFSSIDTGQLAQSTRVGDDNGSNKKKKDGILYDHGFTGAEIECVVNTVIENKFLEYVSISKPEDRPSVLKVEMSDFNKVIDEMRNHILYNQTSDDNSKDNPVKNIRKLNETFKFKSASEASDKK